VFIVNRLIQRYINMVLLNNDINKKDLMVGDENILI